MDLVELVYMETSSFPKEEIYGLRSQIRRAAASIPANIAEGQGRRLPKEFLYFLANARGSILELDTHLEIAFRLKYLSSERYESLLNPLYEVGRILNGLMRSVEHSQTLTSSI